MSRDGSTYVAERANDGNRTFVIRDQDGAFVGMLSFRSICGLAAVEAGQVRTVKRRRSWYGMYDEWFEPHTDLFGVGTFTLQNLQSDGLAHPCCSMPDAPVCLTSKGMQVLACIRAAGVQVLMTERLAAA